MWDSLSDHHPRYIYMWFDTPGAKSMLDILFYPLHRACNVRRGTFSGCMTKYSWCYQKALEFIKACGLSSLWRSHGSRCQPQPSFRRGSVQEEPTVAAVFGCGGTFWNVPTKQLQGATAPSWMLEIHEWVQLIITWRVQDNSGSGGRASRWDKTDGGMKNGRFCVLIWLTDCLQVLFKMMDETMFIPLM